MRQFLTDGSPGIRLHATHGRVVDSRQCCRTFERLHHCFRRTSKCPHCHSSMVSERSAVMETLAQFMEGMGAWTPTIVQFFWVPTVKIHYHQKGVLL